MPGTILPCIIPDLAQRNLSPATSGGSLRSSTPLCPSLISPTNTCLLQGLDTFRTRYRGLRNTKHLTGVPWFPVSGSLRA